MSVVWGWYGVGGAVAMLALGCFAAVAAWLARAESTWQPAWRQLAGSWRSLLQDTRGREFIAKKDAYRRLDEGDVVDCEIVRPLRLPARLQSCTAPQR